ncbi:MAG: hypothetical protein AB7P33_11335 [Dehalococcoidia bacterium]
MDEMLDTSHLIAGPLAAASLCTTFSENLWAGLWGGILALVMFIIADIFLIERGETKRY